jgi:modulator of FtsH protease HflK
MESKSKNGLLNTIILLIVAGSVFAVARYAHSLAGQVAAAFVGLGFVVSLASWFQMRLEERERLERLEFEEMTKGRSTGALFKEDESEIFPTRKSREQFERFFIPAITILLLLAEGVGAWLLWQWAQKATRLPLNRPAVALAFFGVFFLVLFLLGRYSAGLARLRNDRLLRPSANHLLLSAYACGVVALTIVAAWSGFPQIDYYAALVGVVLLGVLAAENLIGLILELYRPRMKGKAARLLYESRLVGLLSHPEGLFSTAAHVLDYQFGFKVSETWAYQSFRRFFPYVLVGQIVVLLLSSCVVFIEAGEQGLLERFGAPVQGRAVLGPGVHAKWFWPVDRVHRFHTDQIQTFNIGFVHEEENDHAQRPEEEVVLWTVSHYKEEFNLLVASREAGGSTNAVDGKKVPPVNLLSVSIPVQFHISDLRKWAYNHLTPAKVLQEIGTREVVRYLVGVDFMEIMSTGRFKAAEELQGRIQKRADELELGVRIVFLGLQDIHPPVAVAGSYEAVIGAEQKRVAERLAAQADAVATNGWSQAEAMRRKREAEADREGRIMDAAARAAQFTNQMPAYRASPTVYAQLAYFQALNRGGAGARKIISAVTNTDDVVLLNLEEKLRPDLLDLPAPSAPTPSTRR